jgi:hypothetical protein
MRYPNVVVLTGAPLITLLPKEGKYCVKIVAVEITLIANDFNLFRIKLNREVDVTGVT